MSVAEALIYTGVPSGVAIGVIGYFRAEVRTFLANTKHLKIPGGFEFTSGAQSQIATDPETQALPAPVVPPAPEPVAVENGLPPAGMLVAQVEETLRAELQARSPDDPINQLSVSVRALAAARVLLAHEANYRVIFSTQIMLLKAVNDNSVRTTAQAMFWYGIFHERLPDVAITFDAWLGFLENCGYLIVGERVAGAPSSLTIDPFGRDFLLWMIHNGISEVRPG